MKKYELVLWIPHTTKDDALDLDFSNDSNSKDIDSAIEKFNIDVAQIKQLKVIKKGYNRLILELLFYKEKKGEVTARDLIKFSQYLYNEQNWKRFVDPHPRYNNKLFRLLGEPRLLDDEKKNSVEIEERTDLLSDEDAKKAFETLLIMQNIGSEESQLQKQSAVKKIKALLMNAL